MYHNVSISPFCHTFEGIYFEIFKLILYRHFEET
jgi:hypothetical protein